MSDYLVRAVGASDAKRHLTHGARSTLRDGGDGEDSGDGGGFSSKEPVLCSFQPSRRLFMSLGASYIGYPKTDWHVVKDANELFIGCVCVQ